LSFTPISPNNFNKPLNLNRDVQSTLDAAFQRGDVGRTGVKGNKPLIPREEPSRSENPLASRQTLKDGTIKTQMADGRIFTEAPNGLIKEERPDGSFKISLPNGMQIMRNERGETLVHGNEPGENLNVGTRQSKTTGQFEFRFADKEGNSFKIYSNDLKMEISNKSGETSPKSEVNTPNQSTNNYIAGGHGHGGCPGHGTVQQPGNIGVLPPIFNGPDSGDPYAPQMTPSGVIRQENPDGSLFISLPHGVVVSQMQDGQCSAYDSRYPGQIFPAVARDINIPGKGPDRELNYTDGGGNLYTMYSKSQDFAVESRDRRVQQVVFPDGTMAIMAKTNDPQTGLQQNHRIMIDPAGRVNTFGEKGVAVGKDQLVFKNGEQSQILGLPYPVPAYQSLIGQMYPASPNTNRTASEFAYPQGFNPHAGAGFNQNYDAGQNCVNHPEQPMHKGVWGKIKDFLGFDSGNEQAKQMMKNSNQAYSGCQPCNTYDPGDYMKQTNNMMKGTMALTAGMSIFSMLSTLPMMFFGFSHMGMMF